MNQLFGNPRFYITVVVALGLGREFPIRKRPGDVALMTPATRGHRIRFRCFSTVPHPTSTMARISMRAEMVRSPMCVFINWCVNLFGIEPLQSYLSTPACRCPPSFLDRFINEPSRDIHSNSDMGIFGEMPIQLRF